MASHPYHQRSKDTSINGKQPSSEPDNAQVYASYAFFRPAPRPATCRSNTQRSAYYNRVQRSSSIAASDPAWPPSLISTFDAVVPSTRSSLLTNGPNHVTSPSVSLRPPSSAYIYPSQQALLASASHSQTSPTLQNHGDSLHDYKTLSDTLRSDTNKQSTHHSLKHPASSYNPYQPYSGSPTIASSGERRERLNSDKLHSIISSIGSSNTQRSSIPTIHSSQRGESTALVELASKLSSTDTSSISSQSSTVSTDMTFQDTEAQQQGGKPPTDTEAQQQGGKTPIHRRECRLCPCCRCTIGCCLLTTLLILIILGVTAFFVWPRIPNVELYSATPITLPEVNLDALRTGQALSFSSRWNVTIGVDNKNYIAWHFDEITGTLIDPSTSREVGNGSLTDFTLSPRENITMTIPVDFAYTAQNGTGGLVDPIIGRILTTCISRSSKLSMLLRIQVVIPVIRWFTKPTFERDINIDCPFD
jgi:hypothetical protein